MSIFDEIAGAKRGNSGSSQYDFGASEPLKSEGESISLTQLLSIKNKKEQNDLLTQIRQNQIAQQERKAITDKATLNKEQQSLDAVNNPLDFFQLKVH